MSDSAMSAEKQFEPFARRMQAAGVPEIAVGNFRSYYLQLVEGRTGLIPERAIEPQNSLTDMLALAEELSAVGREAHPRTVIIKLNGGLGTSMGLDMPKSLITIKNDMTFLEIIASQAAAARTPFLLMNSFATHDDSCDALRHCPGVREGLPTHFLQHMVPKILQADLTPAVWPANPALEWCPPGHGDIYPAMITSGVLDALLESGYRYAFISNSDNLGAVLDDSLLGYFVSERLPFMMETALRTIDDRKGGHLARYPGGRLLLREVAQCPPEEMAFFQDTERYRFFNTNSLWVSLSALGAVMAEQGNVLDLPMIRNPKTLDPADLSSPPVFQLESAMGAAISLFEGAQAILVPRSRFFPIKTTDDLLAIQSDAYSLDDDFRITRAGGGESPPPSVSLDRAFYGHMSQLRERFPLGPPSLRDCRRLVVEGDFLFGRDVVLRGEARLVNETSRQVALADGEVLEGERRYR